MNINKTFPSLQYAIYRCDCPTPLPQQSHVIYVRKEPFENPTDLDKYTFDIASISNDVVFENININKNDFELIEDVKLSIYRALWGNIIPSLRKVTLQWDSEGKKFEIIFYHDGPITASIYNHYSCVHVEVEADFVFDPKSDFKIVRCDYPSSLPLDCGIVLYLKKEPFTDPI